MARRVGFFLEPETPANKQGICYYVCDTESDKPDPSNTGDLAYVKSSKRLYVADGTWVYPFPGT